MEDKMRDALKKLEPKEKARKKRVNPKSKGKTGEYYFANMLTEISGLHFQRIFTSGAAVGRTNRHRLGALTVAQGEQQLGDIASPETLRHMLIWESKNYADLDIHNLISGREGSKTFFGWLDEMMYDVESALTAMNTPKRPMGFLCVKLTRKGAWITVNAKGFYETFGSRPIFSPPYVMLEREPRPALKEAGWGAAWIMIDFERFVRDNRDFMFQQMDESEMLAFAKALIDRGVRPSLKDQLRGKEAYLEGGE